MTMINAFSPDDTTQLDAAARELVRRRENLLGPAYRLFYREPVHIVRGEGAWLYDTSGARFLDVYNNVASVGHCHPHVTQAMCRQAATLNTHTRYLHGAILEYAERLLESFPGSLGRIMFTCTGSEANDLAIRIAKSATGGTGLIATALAYHGGTETAAAVSPSLGAGFAQRRDVRLVPPPDRRQSGDPAAAFARAVDAAATDLKRDGVQPAALILDSLFSSDGIFSDPVPLIVGAAEAIRRAGGLFIADEVQAGFGRTGAGMWGFARHGVAPDLVTMGKPMGNGYPLAGVALRPELVAEFGSRSRYFNTFGGSPVAAAVGMAVLDVIEAEGLINRARDVGAYLRDGLRALASAHPIIFDIRGTGLFIGVELAGKAGEPATEETARVVNALRDRRILISATGLHANVLKIRPPLVFSREQADTFVEALDDVLAAL